MRRTLAPIRSFAVSMLVVSTLSACTDRSIPTAPKNVGPAGGPMSVIAPVYDGSTNCWNVSYAYWDFYRDQSSMAWTDDIATGQWIELAVRPFDANGCPVDGSGQLTTSRPDLMEIVFVGGNRFRIHLSRNDGSFSATLTYTPQYGSTLTHYLDLFRPRIELVPAQATVAPNSTIVLTARAFDSGNIAIPTYGWPTNDPTWWSEKTSVATVARGGNSADATTATVAGVASGTTRVHMLLLGVEAISNITVAAPVYSVTITGPTFTLSPAESVTYTAVAKDASGNVIPGKTAKWSIDNTYVATVSSTGTVTGQHSGSTTLRATIDGVPGTASISVIRCNDCSGWIPTGGPLL